MKTLLAALLLFNMGVRAEDDGWPGELTQGQQQVERLNRAARAPDIGPQTAADISRQRQKALETIVAIADSRPNNPVANLAVGKSLASIEEAPRAIAYAERGLKLAETSGDPIMIREALLTGSEVYYRAGNYDLARRRAQRLLEDNPRDKAALSLYMQVKGRGTASTEPPAGRAGGSAPAIAGRASDDRGSNEATTTGGDGAATMSAASIEARKQISLGWNRIKLDPTEALKNFEAAITADPLNAAIYVQRSKARLELGDARGALGDASEAIRLDPRLAEAFAARGEAKHALGRADRELLADYEMAANLDGRFTEAYTAVLLRTNGAKSAPADGDAQSPGEPRSLLLHVVKGWWLLALIVVAAAALGGVLIPLFLKKRRSNADDFPPR